MKQRQIGFSLQISNLFVSIISLFAVAGSQAADEDIFFSELPIVASVSRLPQRLADAPTAVTVVDHDMIKASGARDLSDVLRLVPGFQTYPNNTDAARVTYHGQTDEAFSPRVQVLIDGRSQYSPLFRNGVNWATLPVAIEDIERIEVVRGTNAVSYGSNAFLGVINIITVDPALVRGVSGGVNHGNQGVRDYTLRAGGKLGDVGNFRFTYQQKSDNGLSDQFDWEDSFRSRMFSVRSDFSLSERDNLEITGGYIEAVLPRGRLAKTGTVLTGGWDPGSPYHEFEQSSAYVQALWRRTLAPDADLQLRYAYTQDKAAEDYLYQKDFFLGQNLFYHLDEFGDKGTRHEIEAVHNFALGRTARISWGGAYRWDSMTSPVYFHGNETVNRTVGRLFGNLEWKPVDWFTGNLGLSGEQDSLADDHLSPRVSGNFHLTPENTIRLGYARAYRTGSPVDFRGDQWITPVAYANGSPFPSEAVYKRKFYGNPDLESEKLTSTEIGFLGDWRKYRMSLDVRVFEEKIPNKMFVLVRRLRYPAQCMVTTIGGACTNVGANADFTTPAHSVKTRGLEYQLRWQPFDSTRLMLNQAFIKTSAENLESVWPNTNITTLRSSGTRDEYLQLSQKSAPSHNTTIMLMQKLPLNIDFSLIGYWVGDMKWTRHTAVAAYKRYDARLGYPFRYGRLDGEVAYTVQSLNGDHGEFKSNGDPADRVVERRHWLSLRFGF